MKKIIFTLLILFLISCGREKQNKKGFEYKRTQQNEKKNNSITKSSIKIDFNNKGIGPIKSFNFNDNIDKKLVEKGSIIFKQKCTACHMPDKKLIGPSMKGIYERRSPEWVLNMILNPIQMIKEDPIAIDLLKKNNGIIMLNQNITEEEAIALSEYFRSF